MALLVDATTAEHALGIGVVINQFLGALAECPEQPLVARGPTTTVDRRLASEVIPLARSEAGRVLFQRFLLPYYADRRRIGGSRIDSLLLMDAYVPHVPLHEVSCTCYIHDVLPLTEGSYWSASSLLVKRADFYSLKRKDVRLVASTSHNAAQIRLHLGRHADVVPYGCGQLSDHAADELMARGPGPRSSTILYIGGLDPRKNIATLVEAFISGRDQLADDAELLIVGKPRGTGTEEILRAIEDGRRFGIRHLPSVSTQEALALIDGAGALVLPSADEGFGLPLLEALASGTPAVAADIPAIRAWAGESLIYAPPGDASGLASALAAALNLPDADRSAGQQFAAEFRWRRFRGDLLDIAGDGHR